MKKFQQNSKDFFLIIRYKYMMIYVSIIRIIFNQQDIYFKLMRDRQTKSVHFVRLGKAVKCIIRETAKFADWNGDLLRNGILRLAQGTVKIQASPPPRDIFAGGCSAALQQKLVTSASSFSRSALQSRFYLPESQVKLKSGVLPRSRTHECKYWADLREGNITNRVFGIHFPSREYSTLRTSIRPVEKLLKALSSNVVEETARNKVQDVIRVSTEITRRYCSSAFSNEISIVVFPAGSRASGFPRIDMF